MLSRIDKIHISYSIEKIQELSDYMQREFGVDPDLAYELIALCYLKDIADNTEQLNNLHVSVSNVD